MWWFFNREKEIKVLTSILPNDETGGGPDWGYAVAKNESGSMEDAVSIIEDVAGFRFFAWPRWQRRAVLAAKKIFPAQLASCLRACADAKMAIRGAFRTADEELRELLMKGSAASDHEVSSGTARCCAWRC